MLPLVAFVVEKVLPGMTIERLEHKLGIKASDTAAISLLDFRVPAANLLGNAEIDVAKGFAGVMETFDNTRPLSSCNGHRMCKKHPSNASKKSLKMNSMNIIQHHFYNLQISAARIYRMEKPDWEAARVYSCLKLQWNGRSVQTQFT